MNQYKVIVGKSVFTVAFAGPREELFLRAQQDGYIVGDDKRGKTTLIPFNLIQSIQ